MLTACAKENLPRGSLSHQFRYFKIGIFYCSPPRFICKLLKGNYMLCPGFPTTFGNASWPRFMGLMGGWSMKPQLGVGNGSWHPLPSKFSLGSLGSFMGYSQQNHVWSYIGESILVWHLRPWMDDLPIPISKSKRDAVNQRKDSSGKQMVRVHHHKTSGKTQVLLGEYLNIVASTIIILLHVIPAMTFIHFVTGKSSGILSGISSGILSGISSNILSGISSGISVAR